MIILMTLTLLFELFYTNIFIYLLLTLNYVLKLVFATKLILIT